GIERRSRCLASRCPLGSRRRSAWCGPGRRRQRRLRSGRHPRCPVQPSGCRAVAVDELSRRTQRRQLVRHHDGGRNLRRRLVRSPRQRRGVARNRGPNSRPRHRHQRADLADRPLCADAGRRPGRSVRSDSRHALADCARVRRDGQPLHRNGYGGNPGCERERPRRLLIHRPGRSNDTRRWQGCRIV
ncbi:MAG: hypothetical protein AVDCRST_MAG19-3356, partial [uncultured Thermomicrobiales bacterium]